MSEFLDTRRYELDDDANGSCIEPAGGGGIRNARHIVKQAHRQQPRQPKPIPFSPQDSMTALAETIAKRIFVNRKSAKCGSWLLGTKDGRVFVLRENDLATPNLLRQHNGAVIGRYAADQSSGCRVRTPKPEEVREDLVDHFAALGLAVRP
jgi:hypothetical protein